MARKSTRRPSQKEQPTMSQPAPTLRETVEELAADEEFAYSQGYDDAVSEGRFDDEVEESYSQGYGQGTTDSGVVDPVAEGAMYGETIDPDILGRRRPDRNPLG